MQDAFGQARTYADTIEPPPPFVIVTDIGYCFDFHLGVLSSRAHIPWALAVSGTLEDRPYWNTTPTVAEPRIWPKELPQQIAAIRDLVGTNGEVWSVELASRQFKGARKKEIESVLDSLAALGLLISFETPQGRRWRA